jgi:hypothetical protein
MSDKSTQKTASHKAKFRHKDTEITERMPKTAFRNLSELCFCVVHFEPISCRFGVAQRTGASSAQTVLTPMYYGANARMLSLKLRGELPG